MSESKRPRGKYKTTNWASYNASLKAHGSLTVWLDKDLQWYAPATGKRGRQPIFSDATIQFCLSIKSLLGLPMRQSLGMVESLLRLAGLDLLVDSTGIKFLGEGECKRNKHGADYRRQWRKVHLAIDAHTLDIRAIEVTDNATGDARMLPELLSQIPAHEPIASVGGDGAYDTKACHAAIARRNAQAIIPPRKNARAWKSSQTGAASRNEALQACQRLGRRIWKKWIGYHRRSLVETKMNCFKQLGERVMARTFERQVTELHIRVALLNRFSQLGRPVTVAVA